MPLIIVYILQAKKTMKHTEIFVGILEVRDTACFRRPGMIRPTEFPEQDEVHALTRNKTQKKIHVEIWAGGVLL
jgi:hypothetical protein